MLAALAPPVRGQELQMSGDVILQLQRRERFLTSEELARLGDAIREAQTSRRPQKPTVEKLTLRPGQGRKRTLSKGLGLLCQPASIRSHRFPVSPYG